MNFARNNYIYIVIISGGKLAESVRQDVTRKWQRHQVTTETWDTKKHWMSGLSY